MLRRRLRAISRERPRCRPLACALSVPEHVRADNGPELTANALRDWCRFSGPSSAYIEPGSPWQNPFVESFGSRVRDELLAVELFETLTEAQVMVAEWREDYNQRRPHSALGMTAPASFARAWRERTGHREADQATRAVALRSPFRARCARRPHDYAPTPNRPPALTRGGPMNEVRS